jgi:2-dehydropantoate 2-reductase
VGVWGAGAMGGCLGAWWSRAGVDVLLVDADPDHVASVRRDGLRVTGPVDTFTARAPVLTPEEVPAWLSEAALGKQGEGGPASNGQRGLGAVYLAVKAHHTMSAMRSITPLLEPDGYVVSVQNGLNERAIARFVGQERTVGCFVNFGADVLEPGVVMRGNRGAVVVGELDGSTTPRIREVHGLMTLFDENAVLTPNIRGFLWGKLAYGAILFATALTEASIADVLASAIHRPMLVALAREVMAVAEARGIRPEPFDGFDPGAFHPSVPMAEALESLDRLVAFNRSSAKTHSGVWRDLAVRKRKTEVDAQIAIVGELGQDAGVQTPLVDRLVELIHQVEDGRRSQGWSALDALAGLPEAQGGAAPDLTRREGPP